MDQGSRLAEYDEAEAACIQTTSNNERDAGTLVWLRSRILYGESPRLFSLAGRIYPNLGA